MKGHIEIIKEKLIAGRDTEEILIGTMLRNARLHKKVKQKDIAKALGVSQSVYSAYEKGINRVPAWILIKASEFLEIPIESMITLEYEYKDVELLNSINHFISKASESELMEITKAFEIQTALKQSPEENKKDSSQIAWASVGIDIANNINEQGQKFIKDYIEAVASNPMFLS